MHFIIVCATGEVMLIEKTVTFNSFFDQLFVDSRKWFNFVIEKFDENNMIFD